MLFLGLRGQAKTRILRMLPDLLDEWMPVAGRRRDQRRPARARSTKTGKRIVAEQGDDAKIEWVHRDDRYHEKLATPDVTIADLIGEIDLVKHAEGRYLSDEIDDALRPDPALQPRASSRSTNCPTSPRASRSACSTCWKSATSRSAATRSG